jgi:UDP-N-acetyl-D-glucosamine dehydrogenase
MKIIADKLDIDIFETIKAASSKPFGYMPFYPGPGLGGHCIPVDPFILAWRAKEFDVPAKFIELSGEINDQMPKYVVEKCVSILNANNKKVKNSKVIILGVTYKKNSADLRESPSIKIIKLLLEMKAKISLSDKFLPKYLKIKEKKLLNLTFTKNLLKNFDCIILLTDHDYFDYKNIKKTSKLLVDCRGRFEVSSKVIRA